MYLPLKLFKNILTCALNLTDFILRSCFSFYSNKKEKNKKIRRERERETEGETEEREREKHLSKARKLDTARNNIEQNENVHKKIIFFVVLIFSTQSEAKLNTLNVILVNVLICLM
jgi:hypothetical protein